jgi:SAM-dependent methyltransferase
MPAHPTRVLDIGAGVGRDAAWFVEKGHSVLAVEPVDALREAGMERYATLPINWLGDRLPGLAAVLARNETFGLVMITAVWAHLDREERTQAMPNVARLVANGGRLILSIRDGWAPESRPVFDAAPEETIELAEASGLRLMFQTTTESIQSLNKVNDVRWHSLAFERRL